MIPNLIIGYVYKLIEARMQKKKTSPYKKAMTDRRTDIPTL